MMTEAYEAGKQAFINNVEPEDNPYYRAFGDLEPEFFEWHSGWDDAEDEYYEQTAREDTDA